MTAVLVGEHNLQVAAPLSDALRSQGYDVALVEDGPSVLRSAASGWAGLVVLDARPARRCRRQRARGGPRAAHPGVRPAGDHGVRRPRASPTPSAASTPAPTTSSPCRCATTRCWPASARCCAGRVPSRSRCKTSGSTLPRGGPGCRTSEIALTTKEFELLRVLVREAGSVVTREQLIREVWDSTGGGRPRPSTCTSPGCAASSATRPRTRATSAPYAGSASASSEAERLLGGPDGRLERRRHVPARTR